MEVMVPELVERDVIMEIDIKIKAWFLAVVSVVFIMLVALDAMVYLAHENIAYGTRDVVASVGMIAAAMMLAIGSYTGFSLPRRSTTQKITELDKAKKVDVMPFLCPDCMKKHNIKPSSNLHKECFDCAVMTGAGVGPQQLPVNAKDRDIITLK